MATQQQFDPLAAAIYPNQQDPRAHPFASGLDALARIGVTTANPNSSIGSAIFRASMTRLAMQQQAQSQSFLNSVNTIMGANVPLDDTTDSAGNQVIGKKGQMYRLVLTNPVAARTLLGEDAVKAITESYFKAGGLDDQQKRLNLTKTQAEIDKLKAEGGPVPTDITALPKNASEDDKQAFLDKLPPATAEIVKGLADYSLDPAKTSSLFRSNERQKMLALAKMYDPSFDMKEFNKKQTFLNDFVKGTTQTNIVALNTLSEHLGTLNGEIDALKNSRLPAANAFVNFARRWTGDPTISNFETAKEAVLGESQRVFSGVGATQQGIERSVKNLQSRASYDQMKGFVKTMAALMQGRGKAWENRYQAVMGKPAGDLVYSPDTRAALDAILGGSGAANDASASGPYQEGQTATNPRTGQKLVFTRGQWVPR